MCVCKHACVCVRARVCVCARVCVRARVCVQERRKVAEGAPHGQSQLHAFLPVLIHTVATALLSAFPSRKIPVALYHPTNDDLILLTLTQIAGEGASCTSIKRLIVEQEAVVRKYPVVPQ